MTFNCQVGGCALLKLYDADNDGKVTSSDALRAQNDGRTSEEVQFILEASTRGSINAMCPGCYTSPEASPAKGEVYNLDYPANAKNGETITIKASVLNTGGTSGNFSLRVIAAPQLLLVTRYVGWVAPDRFSVLESLSVTMPSSGSSANLAVQCIRYT